ncbi:hypothetical protein B0A49_02078 [Cryomyces minteri]|uniref:SWIRM domain-containing protein n=1 Tax=Cryomyces minteri TaxID=331657 RepID=A0A4U0XAV4_9PEZI|nr:hypothetical protein B0A49_02078 [Cryomyces minteri]
MGPLTTSKVDRLTVSSLLSPPEVKPYESFSSMPFTMANTWTTSQSLFQSNVALPQMRNAQPLSPPISPEEELKEDIGYSPLVEDTASQDHQLFASNRIQSRQVDFPLFPSDQTEVEAVVERHIAASGSPKEESKPSRDDYVLAVSCVWASYNRNPAAYLRRERAFLSAQSNRVEKPASRVLKKIAPAPSIKIRRQKMPTLAPRPRAFRTQRTPKSTPLEYVLNSFDYSFDTPASTATTPRPPKAPKLVTNRDDVDYNALPDYSPPLSSLPAGNKALKADWKGQILDLSTDPDRHLLHEAEVHLAATLRLSCATYLCSKRRIFEARLETFRRGKVDFRKTDAQQACKIDVNKASKLWTAFDRVGWLRKEYIEMYL